MSRETSQTASTIQQQNRIMTLNINILKRFGGRGPLGKWPTFCSWMLKTQGTPRIADIALPNKK